MHPFPKSTSVTYSLLSSYRRPKKTTERAGFEPAVPKGTPVFETGSISHSDTSPVQAFYKVQSESASERFYRKRTCLRKF